MRCDVLAFELGSGENATCFLAHRSPATTKRSSKQRHHTRVHVELGGGSYFTMTSKRKPAVVSPIPAVVEVAENDVHNSLLLRFHSATPAGKMMATTSKAVTPLAVFQGDGRYFKHQASSDYGGDGDSTTVPERLGIRKPAYYRDDDSSRYTNGGSSFRIGISRPSYEAPEGGAPLSPLNLFLEKKATSPTPNLIELDRSEDSADICIAWNNPSRSWEASRDSYDEQQDNNDDDSIERMIHEATAEGHYLVNSAAVSTPKDDIKFSLTKGKAGLNKAMRRASERHVTRPPRPSMNNSHSTPGRLGAPDASFKIFLLLLNPQAKIFELIQVIYAPSVTTIGDVLSMIPGNATEPALGSLSYVGLCRPKDGVEITDMQLMASGSHCKKSCARILLGEILVSIPAGFSGKQCAKLAIPILNNQRIQNLLKRSDPLGVKRKHHRSSLQRSSNSHGSHHRRSSHSSRVETVKEESEGENSPRFKQALKHAMEAAARDNACLPETDRESVARAHSPNSMEYWRTATDLASAVTDNDSMASSVVSSSSYKSGQSNSFTIQSTSRRLPSMSRSITRRKHIREQRKYYVGRVAAVALVAMVARFMTDNSAPTGRDDMHEIFGWTGIIQFLILFVALIKGQKYARGGHNAETKCPFVRASIAAVKTFQEQFKSQN